MPKNFRQDFPIFERHPDMTYLDSTATALKPQCVIDKLTEYYTNYSANTLRGIYSISEQATQESESTREAVRKFLHAKKFEEIIFTRNTTESLNLLAYTLLPDLQLGDEIAVTAMEHHSNFVPWQQLAKKYNLTFTVIPFDSNGEIDPEILREYISEKTKIFSFAHVSNVLGTINPAKALIQKARTLNPNILTVIDGAQAVMHLRVDVQDIDCDFYAFSSHKIFGPTGVGVLYGKKNLLEHMPPFLYGGEMVQSVTTEETVFQELPHKFEAGTPSIGEIIGLGEALRYIENIGFDSIHAQETELTEYAATVLRETFGSKIHILGPREPDKRCSLFSFTLEGVHPHDIAQILAEEDICVRAGSHCAMPLHKHLQFACPASVRASFSIYNSTKDIDKLIEGLKKAQKIFGVI